MIRGGPSDSQKGIVCAFGFSTNYAVTHQTSSSVTIHMSEFGVNNIYKPSQLCLQRYFENGVFPPQNLTINVSEDRSQFTLGGPSVFTRKPVKAPTKVWTVPDINAFIDYYRGLMKIY
jgi:hypothetical protein